MSRHASTDMAASTCSFPVCTIRKNAIGVPIILSDPAPLAGSEQTYLTEWKIQSIALFGVQALPVPVRPGLIE